jgi:plasmid replication initiation protein
MEHPLFALKAGDRRVRRYERNGNSVEVKPGPDGCATIHDKDIWIYCISLLIDALNRGRNDLNRTVRFTAYDFLVTTNRQTSGEGYRLMGEALSRLRATTIETNIETAGQRERRGFGLIDAWHVVEKGPDNRAVAVSVTLPEWLYRSVQARHVLTLSRDYFRIRKPLNRRIYELARKHCGTQPAWRVSIAILHAKSGSTATLAKFRLNVKALTAGDGGLLDYRLVLDIPNDTVTFYARGAKGTAAQANAQANSAARKSKPSARRG